MLIPNVQLFADPPAQPDTPAAEPGAQPENKTFSGDYVSALRNESAGYRTRAKSAEAALRTVLGIKDGEELGDLDKRIEAYRQNQQSDRQAALEAANARIIQAEMKGLDSYNLKLLGKLIDLSKVSVKEDGSVEGLKEAAELAAQEFPEVRKTPPPFSRGTKGPTQTPSTDKEKANAALRAVFRKD